jgi:hypothetical protein
VLETVAQVLQERNQGGRLEPHRTEFAEWHPAEMAARLRAGGQVVVGQRGRPSRLIIPPRPEIIAEAGEFFPVQGCELFEGGGALIGQGQPDDPPVIGVFLADDQPDGLGALGQLDGTVVAKQQIPGHLTDGRPTGVVMPPHGEQQLMLGGS